ncbi:MAG: hypothetical protein ALECFALPRED_000298 [Alectoria fallacina]|uniref:MARVEL domain-containing protein n=1 Tax=Alectoria fallacina TaxID=1903189 RepID=A0A8H3J9L5_9LECA|nr:MAG: hypothetical protein ALECFALPRED_000298 [Alectoria fallacina]
MSKLALGTRAASTSLRALEFAISALVLGIFSWYLAYLADHHLHIPKWEKAVEGMAGGAVIYTGFAVILTCFLGGITFFAFLGLLLDLLFCGCFVAIAVLAKAGAKSCGTVNNSPIGTGAHVSCQLQRAVFAVAIANACLFLISAALEIVLSRARKREKRYGPSPANNYTSGSGKKRFWQKKNNKNKTHKHEDEELGGVGAGALVADEKHRTRNNRNSERISNDTAMTGTTAPVADSYGGPNTKYSHEPTVPTQNYPGQTNGYASQQGADGYGGSNTKYGQEPTVPNLTHPGQNEGYANQQSLNTASGGAARAEMESNVGGGRYAQHVSEPYANVHQGGYVHQAP